MKRDLGRADVLAAVLAVLVAAPLRAADVAAPETARAGAAIPALPSSAISFGGDFASGVGKLVDGISLKETAALPGSIEKLQKAYEGRPTPESRLVLAALSQPSAALQAALARTDVPKAAAERLVKLAAAAQKQAAKNAAFAAQLQAVQKLVASTPEKSDKLSKLVDSVIASWSAKPSAPAEPETPVVTAPSVPSQPQAPSTTQGDDWEQTPHGPRRLVSFLGLKLPGIAMPSLGDVISTLWTKTHDAAPVIIQANYNFDDMDIAQSIVDKAKAGQKQILVGDYSNWFPDRMPQAKHGGKTTPRTQAMELILANLGPNLELHILKGLGDIGINHNKFTIFYGPNGEKLLQSGSFNYTKTSQNNHWENVVFTDDADRIAYYEKYFAWLTRRARPYSPDLQPEDPKFDPADPIPQPPAVAGQNAFHGVPFPKASYSPNGGTEGLLVKAESLVQRALDILMFSPFPTQKMSAQITALLQQGKPVRMVADAGQVSHASLLVPLMKAGMQVRIIKGPDVEVQHQPAGEHSKQHEKVMLFDAAPVAGQQPDGLIKAGDSLNISNNALAHNFENTEFWSEPWLVRFMQNHFEYVWGLAHPMDEALLQKLSDENDKFMAGEGRTSPWNGEPNKVEGGTPAAPTAPAAGR